MYIEIKVVDDKGKTIDKSKISVLFPVIYKDWHDTPVILEESGNRVKLLIGYEFRPTTIWQDKFRL